MALVSPHGLLGSVDEANRTIENPQQGESTVGSKGQTLNVVNGKEDRTNPAARSRSQQIETQSNLSRFLKPAHLE